MNPIERTYCIEKYNCSIGVSEEKSKHSTVCKVECVCDKRKNNWQQIFESVYGGYAMLIEKHLLDLPGKRFLVQQINEHSRGGHREYEVYLLDLCGKTLNKFAGSYNSKFLLEDKYVWFYVSAKKPNSDTFNLDLKMVKLNYKTGKTETFGKGELPSHIYEQFWN